jgi:3-oxoacyl-[acyl-carrier-protein] synthase III
MMEWEDVGTMMEWGDGSAARICRAGEDFTGRFLLMGLHGKNY